MAAARPGERVADVFAAYAAMPPGPLKRAKASNIIRANEALLQSTIDGLCGRRALPLRRRLDGCAGFDMLEPDDAMQVGRMAFAKALDQYDPQKGKFPWYLLQKCRYELYKLETWGHHLLHVPEAHVATHRKHVALFGSPSDLDNASDQAEVQGVDYGGVADLDISPDDVRGWEETGEWPEDLEQWRRERAHLEPETEPAAEPDQRSAVERFLDEELRFRPSAREARRPVFDAWHRWASHDGAFACDGELRGELARRGVRNATVRVAHLMVAGLAGVELSQTTSA